LVDRPNGAQEVDPICVGQNQIEQDQVEVFAAHHGCHCSLASCRFGDGCSVARQQDAHEHADGGGVINS
jgi:hypothetical protein